MTMLSTRARLVHEAMRLFSERGYAATSVGDIEEAAGLTRRGGAFYRHFTSKHDVLEAAIDGFAATASDAKQLADLLRLDDRRSELLLFGRLLLAELDNEKALHQVLDKEGDRIEAARRRAADEFLHRAYEAMLPLFRRWLPLLGEPDLAAFAVVLCGGLVNLRRNLWTFGAVPLGVDDELALQTWVEIANSAIETHATH